MTYRIDGTPLDYPDLGWVFRSLSNPLPRFEFNRPEVYAGGDGTIAGLPAWVSAPELELVVMTPRENLAALVTLVTRGTYLDDTTRPGQRIHYELLEFTPTGYGNGGTVVDATFRVRYPAVYWRDSVETTSPPTALTAASVNVTVFPGLSAPIGDAIIRVKGACTGLQITDSSGAWITGPDIPAGQYLRIAGVKAWTTSSDTWTGGNDVSGAIDIGGPRDFFEITPNYLDVTDRAGKLTVTTGTRSGATVEIRGRGAYCV